LSEIVSGSMLAIGQTRMLNSNKRPLPSSSAMPVVMPGPLYPHDGRTLFVDMSETAHRALSGQPVRKNARCFMKKRAFFIAVGRRCSV
jgi:hypothetical protein